MTALVIGASGQVGWQIWLRERARGETVGTTHAGGGVGLVELDVRDGAAVRELVARVAPRLVYLTAAVTWVDGVERDPQAAAAVNVAGTGHVLAACGEVGARLVFFSSDYVFDGAAGPYGEEAEPAPLNEYGRQKLAAERLIAGAGGDHVVLRTTTVYGRERRGKNFLERLVRTLAAGEELAAPADQVSNPTYGPDLAAAALELAHAAPPGLYHLCGAGLLDRAAFSRLAARVFALDESLVRPVSTAELDQPAARPLRSGMTCARAEALLGRPLLDAEAGLRAARAAWYEPLDRLG